MESKKMEECSGLSSGTTVTSAGRSSPLPIESLKKRAKFSISSILGEEDKKHENDSVKDSLSKQGDADNIDIIQDNICISPGSPATPIRIPTEAAKYNAFLAQFANPDVAKLYRWPLFWNPWMGMQNTPSTVPRPSMIQQPPFIQSSLRPEGPKIQSENEDNKDSLEAGEIVRPIAFRRPIPEPHLFYKNGYPDDINLKNTRVHSSSPLIEGRRDADMDFKFTDERQNSSFSESDPSNEMVEIEVDEGEDSDNEGAENADSRHEDDGLKGSSCERKKKTRTVFSRSQIFQLETMFDMKRYLSSSERAGLAKALNMTETQVKIWFQNRRNKWKRQIAAEMEAANMSQVAGQRLMQLPYMYSHDEISRGLRSSLPISPVHSGHPIVPPSVHHYYGGILRNHNS